MISRCKCGGRVRAADPVTGAYDPRYGRVLYRQERLVPGKATFKCDKCGKVMQQGLRKGKEAG